MSATLRVRISISRRSSVEKKKNRLIFGVFFKNGLQLWTGAVRAYIIRQTAIVRRFIHLFFFTKSCFVETTVSIFCQRFFTSGISSDPDIN